MEAGKIYAILGPSGCGKTTLLSLIDGLGRPTSGRILFNGINIAQTGLDIIVKSMFSSSFKAITELTIGSHKSLFDHKETGISVFGTTRPHEGRNVRKLSGGQRQRVTIARALASKVLIILAEPTGNLDEDTAGEIPRILKASAHEQGKCVVVVTHSDELAK